MDERLSESHTGPLVQLSRLTKILANEVEKNNDDNNRLLRPIVVHKQGICIVIVHDLRKNNAIVSGRLHCVTLMSIQQSFDRQRGSPPRRGFPQRI